MVAHVRRSGGIAALAQRLTEPGRKSGEHGDLPAATENELTRSGSGRGVRAVDRAIAVMKSFSANEPELTLTQISERVGLNKATVFRILLSLETGGIIARTGKGKNFCLGPALAEMAALSIQKSDPREVARPEMVALSRECGASVHLGVLEGDSVVYIEKVEPATGMLQVKSRIGDRRPLHCTALGKSLLAALPADEASELLGRLTLSRFTANTIVTLAELREELARVRRQGYSVDNGEINELVRCVGVVIRDSRDEAICALSVTTVGLAADSEQFSEIRERTVEAGKRVSQALAASGG